jgi:hypothetical protein
VLSYRVVDRSAWDHIHPFLVRNRDTSMSLPQGMHSRLNWRKATYSIANGDCAEVASDAGVVFVKDTKDPAGPILPYPSDSWRSFISKARMGAYDALRLRLTVDGFVVRRRWRTTAQSSSKQLGRVDRLVTRDVKSRVVQPAWNGIRISLSQFHLKSQPSETSRYLQ